MLRGRTGTLVIVIVLVLVIVAIIFAVRGDLRLGRRAKPITLPVDLQNIIPTSWKPIAEQFEACDFDGDNDTEWLLIYRYDQVQAPTQWPEATDVTRSLIGGVIYDAQGKPVAQTSGDPNPYQPTLIVPYRLLPDFYAGKGQGYLGETKIDVVLHKLPPPEPEDDRCRVDEITIFGYDGDQWPTRLSVFRWQDKNVGYPGVHFVGNARVEVGFQAEELNVVRQVATYNRLLNHRSALCEVRLYNRTEVPRGVAFDQDEESYTIDFCFGTPDDPFYPEGAVVAFLRGHSPAHSEDAPSPTDASYLMPGSELSPVLEAWAGQSQRHGLRVISVTNESTLAPRPEGGQDCLGSSSVPDRQWRCWAESARVTTDIIWSGQIRRVEWVLTSVTDARRTADVRWRIEEGTLR